MENEKARASDPGLLRRGEAITTWARLLSVGLALASLVVLWESPNTRIVPAVLVGAAYVGFALFARTRTRRGPGSTRRLRIAHDLVDATATGLGAALSGGLESPLWLLLYAHVVAVSVRGGLRYAMGLGAFDALVVAGLAFMSPGHPEGFLHVLSILFCAFAGGSTSSYLHLVQRRLSEANRELHARNEQLRQAVERARRMEDEARDHLSRERHANQRLEELDRHRNQYLSNVSHEFRTPLTVIRGYGEHLMNEGPPKDGSLSDVMRVIVESCDQIIDMVETLIEVSRIEEGGDRSVEARPLDFRELVTSSVEHLRLRAAKKGVELELDLPREPVPVQGDPSLLVHLVRKLVDNAVKYSPPGSKVTVRSRAEEGAGLLQVEDSGIGIPAEHIPRIFDKFYMVDGGLARRRRGAGVGLYLAREVVKLHRGEIEVRSRPGEGTVFTVRLPGEVAAEAPAAAHA
jgi:signal transduction histidine kinase